MSDVAHTEPGALKPPLGIGSILSRAFSILGRRFLLLFGPAFAVQLAFTIFNLFVPGLAAPLLIDPATQTFNAAALVPLALYALLGMLVYALIQGVVTVAAYDTATGRPSRVGDYFGAVLRNIVPLIVVSLLSTIAIYIGFVLLVVPGLWLMAVLSVIVPAVVVDQAGFGAFGRSARLTKEYRWPIVGLLIVVILIFLGITLALGGIATAIFGLTGVLSAVTPNPGSIGAAAIIFQIFTAALNAVSYSFLAVAVAVLFARLKEIKEGLGFEDLSRVFD